MEEGSFLVERLVRILNICLRTCKLLLWREGMIETHISHYKLLSKKCSQLGLICTGYLRVICCLELVPGHPWQNAHSSKHMVKQYVCARGGGGGGGGGAPRVCGGGGGGWGGGGGSTRMFLRVMWRCALTRAQLPVWNYVWAYLKYTVKANKFHFPCYSTVSAIK